MGETWFPPCLSGCPDLNWGPLRPERSALPGCATPRERRRVASFGTNGFKLSSYVVEIDNGGFGVNSVSVVGNLATDVEVREVGEKRVANFLLAINRPSK